MPRGAIIRAAAGGVLGAVVLVHVSGPVRAVEVPSSAVTPGLAAPSPLAPSEGARPRRRKYRTTGELLALGPGLVVHGLGQWYAGRRDRALVLVGTEVLSFVLAAQTGSGDAPTRTQNVFMISSALLFGGGWLYDVITTPGAVEDWNVAHGFGTERRSILGVGVDAVRAVVGLPGLPGVGGPLPPAGAPSATGLAVAVASFVAEGVASGEAALAADWVRAELVSTGRFRVVERERMESVLAEQAFQQTGCTTDECAVRLGRLVSAQRIVVGRLGAFLGEYVVTVGVVNVETGEVVVTDSVRGRNASEVVAGLRAMGARLGDRIR